MMTTILKKKPTVGILPIHVPKRKPTVGTLTDDIKKMTLQEVVMMPATKSKNALVAISGNRAEDMVCSSSSLLETLGSTYFGKKITTCEKIAGRKKSDLTMTFEDGTRALLQLKNGTGGGRGWSFDRRQVDKLPTHDGLKELLKSVCLKSGSERNVIANDKELLRQLLLGDDRDAQPHYYLHTTVENGAIVSLSICSTSEFMDAVLKDAYEYCQPKKTCVHLTPLIYLQRKGGGKADHSPSDIQAKLREMPPCMTTII
jgi:hypothetical protein